jgi:AraC-like DNA-binding protein
MQEEKRKEYATLWHDPDLKNLEILRASYITHTFARHTHETFTIGIIEAGAGAFDARGTTHTASPSNLFIIHPDEVHNGYAAIPAGWTYHVLYPDPAVLQQILLEQTGSTRGTPFFPHTILQDQHLSRLTFSLHALLERPSGKLEREISLHELLAYLIAQHASPTPRIPPAGREHQAVARVQDYFHAHIGDNIPLDQLAALVDLNPSYLLRTFRAQVGLPPHAYQIQLRVQQARKLLRDGMSLPQVALELGFADQSHFARHFRHLVGVPPGHYAHPAQKSKTF